jgi:hypothetical protein
MKEKINATMFDHNYLHSYIVHKPRSMLNCSNADVHTNHALSIDIVKKEKGEAYEAELIFESQEHNHECGEH